MKKKTEKRPEKLRTSGRTMRLDRLQYNFLCFVSLNKGGLSEK